MYPEDISFGVHSRENRRMEFIRYQVITVAKLRSDGFKNWVILKDLGSKALELEPDVWSLSLVQNMGKLCLSWRGLLALTLTALVWSTEYIVKMKESQVLYSIPEVLELIFVLLWWLNKVRYVNRLKSVPSMKANVQGNASWIWKNVLVLSVRRCFDFVTRRASGTRSNLHQLKKRWNNSMTLECQGKSQKSEYCYINHGNRN